MVWKECEGRDVCVSHVNERGYEPQELSIPAVVWIGTQCTISYMPQPLTQNKCRDSSEEVSPNARLSYLVTNSYSLDGQQSGKAEPPASNPLIVKKYWGLYMTSQMNTYLS